MGQTFGLARHESAPRNVGFFCQLVSSRLEMRYLESSSPLQPLQVLWHLALSNPDEVVSLDAMGRCKELRLWSRAEMIFQAKQVWEIGMF